MQDYFMPWNELDIAGHISTVSFKRHDQRRVIPAWQQRPLYPFVWLDDKVKQDGRYAAKAYTVLGLNLEGRKEILGLYLSETEGCKLLALGADGPEQSRPARHLIACVDGLTGFPEAINATFPRPKSRVSSTKSAIL